MARDRRKTECSKPTAGLCHASMVPTSPGTRSDLQGREMTSDYGAV
jgi:hypothetical protein